VGAVATLVDCGAASSNGSATGDRFHGVVDPLDLAEEILSQRQRTDLADPALSADDQLGLVFEELLEITRISRSAPNYRSQNRFKIHVDPLFQPQFRILLTARSQRAFDASWQVFVELTLERAITAAAYVSNEIARFYFGKVREVKAAQVIHTIRPTQQVESERLRVVDLPSLPDENTRLVAVKTLLDDIWKEARTEWRAALDKKPRQDVRVPTFHR
jgi:hypothetical protein